MMKIYVVIWTILAFTVVIVSDSGDANLCLPIKALFIWPGNKLEASRIQQNRFVLRLIDELPYRSHIALKVAGNNEEIYEFEKNASYIYYAHRIEDLYLKLSTNNTATNKEVSDAMFYFLDQNEIPKMAEVIYFIVNNNSKLENIQYVNEAIKNKKRFIVLHGEHLEGNVWTSLAQDEQHVQVLGGSEEDVTLTVKSVKAQSCKDSRFVCNTDQYWTEEFGKRCYWCWHICDMIPSQRSDSCNKSCPSYSVEQSKMLKDNDTHSHLSVIIITIIVTVIIMVVLTVIGLLVWCKIQKKKHKNIGEDMEIKSLTSWEETEKMLKDEREKLAAREKVLVQENQALHQQMNKAQTQTAAQHAELMHRVQSLHDSNKILSEERDHAQSQLSQAEAKLSRLEETIQPLQTEIHELKSQRDALAKDKKSILSEVEILRNKTNQLKKQSHKTDRLIQEKDELITKVNSITEDLHKANQEKDELRTKVNSITEDLHKAKQHISQQQEEFNKQIQEKDELGTKVDSITEDLHKAKQQISQQKEEFNKQIEDMKAEHERENAEKAKTIEQISNYERRIGTLEEELQEERRRAQEEIGQLQDRLRDGQTSTEDRHKSELARRDDTIQKLERDILSLQIELHAAVSENDEEEEITEESPFISLSNRSDSPTPEDAPTPEDSPTPEKLPAPVLESKENAYNTLCSSFGVLQPSNQVNDTHSDTETDIDDHNTQA